MRYRRTPKGYRSKFEETIADQFTRSKVPFKYEKETLKYTIQVPSTVCPACGHVPCQTTRSYTPDFTFEDSPIIIEAKGKFDASDRKKMAAVVEQYPDRDVRMVFMADNKIAPRSRTRYSTWCASRDIKYCFKKIPKSWIKELKRGRSRLSKSIDTAP